MTIAMEEDEEAEIIEHVFIAHEIDLDYEFDAARFFDFTRPETPAEAFQAELWFQNAPNYPPSPFVTKLSVREDSLLDDVDGSLKSKDVECASNVDDKECRVSLDMDISETDNGFNAFGGAISGLLAGIPQNDGLTSGVEAIGDSLYSSFKSAVPKNSTLLKPTASQLAKQNRPAKNVGSRFRKVLTQNEDNLSISTGVESQAAKRQKLEGGLLCKVTDVKPQTNFFHKKPTMAVAVEKNSVCSKLKLTIPREPDLKTSHRAQRIRPKSVEDAEHVTVAAPRFKARPLNRRILDAPSLPLPKRSTPQLPEFREFRLKTSERAMQHTSTLPSSLHCNDSNKGWDKHADVSALENRIKDVRRPTAVGAPKHDGTGFTHIFKARPLNKKISSKGHVFRTNKKEPTIPVDFDLHTEKGIQHNPPIDLFSKLSLKSDGQPNNGSQFKLTQQTGMCRKEKPFVFGATQIHPGLIGARRSLGIR